MKLWKKQVNLYYFTSPCSHLSFFSLELPSLPQFEVILFSPVLALHLLAPLLAVLSPVVLLCSFSTAGPSIGREALGAVALQLASRTEKQGGSRKRGTAASPSSSAPSATQHAASFGSCPALGHGSTAVPPALHHEAERSGCLSALSPPYGERLSEQVQLFTLPCSGWQTGQRKHKFLLQQKLSSDRSSRPLFLPTSSTTLPTNTTAVLWNQNIPSI